MRHRLPVLLLVLAAVALGLVSCGPATAEPVALGPAVAASATPAPSALPSATPRPTRTLSPTPRPSDTALPMVEPTLTLPPSPTATPTPTHTPTPMPTLPPIQTPAAGDPVPLALDWWYGANGHLSEGAVLPLDGQIAYVAASLDGRVYAWGKGGALRWRARMAGPVYALAVLDGERLAAGDDAGRVTLLDGAGRTVWQYGLEGRVTDLVTWSGGLLAGGWDQQVTFLDAGGANLWQAGVDGPVSALAALPELALAATASGGIWAFDATGSEAWRFEAGAPVFGLGVIGEGEGARVLASTQDGCLLALDGGGTLRWQLALGQGAPVWHDVDLLGDRVSRIMVGTGGEEPYLALLSAGGQVLWRVGAPAPVRVITALDLDGDGAMEILAGLDSGLVQAYDGQGRLRRTVHAGLPVWGLEIDPATGSSAGSGILVLADVIARRIVAADGPSGSPWLPPPAMVVSPPEGQVPGTERLPGEAILVFVGDVAPGRSMEAQLAQYGPAYPWGEIEPLLQGADLAVANLECVLAAQGEALDKQYLIRAHPRWAGTLSEAGFDLVTVANNHALDYGQEGLVETLDTLAALGVGAVGAGWSRDDAHRPALFSTNGVRIAMLGYAAARWHGSADMPASDQVAWARPAEVQADVRAVREQVDIVVVLMHAGTEYAGEPSPDQVTVARAAVDAGADLVVGHHPHVTQTVERYGKGLIVYSLGDALFDIPRPAAMQGDLLRVHVTQDGLAQAELWPFWIEGSIRPRLLDDGQGDPRFHIIYP